MARRKLSMRKKQAMRKQRTKTASIQSSSKPAGRVPSIMSSSSTSVFPNDESSSWYGAKRSSAMSPKQQKMMAKRRKKCAKSSAPFLTVATSSDTRGCSDTITMMRTRSVTERKNPPSTSASCAAICSFRSSIAPKNSSSFALYDIPSAAHGTPSSPPSPALPTIRERAAPEWALKAQRTATRIAIAAASTISPPATTRAECSVHASKIWRREGGSGRRG
eukprot:2007379-Rhodomonas_salina.1